jgi:hypothetical protein
MYPKKVCAFTLLREEGNRMFEVDEVGKKNKKIHVVKEITGRQMTNQKPKFILSSTPSL